MCWINGIVFHERYGAISKAEYSVMVDKAMRYKIWEEYKTEILGKKRYGITKVAVS